MDEKRRIELIILEVLGCLDEKERMSLQVMKETDEYFPWKYLAEYQNLSALLPSTLKAVDTPSSGTKDIMVKKLNSLPNFTKTSNQPEKFFFEMKQQDKEQLENISEKSKIDWGLLSVPSSPSKDISGFKEVKPKAIAVNRGSIHPFEISSNSSDDYLGNKSQKKVRSSPSLRKYVLTSIILFVISVTIFIYLINNNNKTEMTEVQEESKSTDTVAAVLEQLQFTNLPETENAVEVRNTEPIETGSKPQSEQIILPKAPPNLPDPIEAPLIETKQVIAEETPKVEEEISAPPPKEEILENEEPTYFVAVEEMPQPIGGLQAIQQMIEYPEIARRAGLEGKVFVRAYVDESGSVTNAEIVKGIGGGCDEAALDAILKTKFSPGKQRGKPIKVQVTIPVVFKL